MSSNRFSFFGHSFPDFAGRVLRAIAFCDRQVQGVYKYLILFSLCFALAVGCTGNQTPKNNVVNSQRISVGTTLKPRTLDPADNYELAGLNIIYNVGESLYTYEEGTTEIKPLLATAMPEISDDGLIYTIPVRQGVTFHDGSAFNAEAMAFSLQRFIQNGGKPAFLLGDAIAKVEATQEYELQITLKQPFAAFPALLAFPGACAVSPQAYEIGANSFNPNTLVATGRYKLVSYKSDSISLNANQDYWGDKPANEGVNIQVYAGNSGNLFNSFQTKAIDVAYQSLDPQQIENLIDRAEDKWQVIEGSGTVVNYLAINLQQKPLDIPEIRQAIASIINRALINERVLKGQAEPLYSLIPTALDSYRPTFEQLYGNANVAKAKKLLTKAGYSPAKPAVVEIWHSSGSITRAIVAETIKAYAEQELEAILQFIPKSVESASFFGNLSKGVYSTALVDWYPDFLDADNYIQPFLACGKGSADSGCKEGAAQSRGSFYYSDRANELIEQSRQEQDPLKRQEIFAEIQQLLAEDVPYIPLWQTKDYAFAQNGIQGVVINPSQNFPFWTIKREQPAPPAS